MLTTDRELWLRVPRGQLQPHHHRQLNRLVRKLTPVRAVLLTKNRTAKSRRPSVVRPNRLNRPNQARPVQSRQQLRRRRQRRQQQQENVNQVCLTIERSSSSKRLRPNQKLNQSHQSFHHHNQQQQYPHQHHHHHLPQQQQQQQHHHHYLRKVNQSEVQSRISHHQLNAVQSLKRAASPVNFHLRSGKRTRG